MVNLILEETGVAMLPGTAFGRDPHELASRLCYVDFDGGEALHKVKVDGGGKAKDKFIEKYCANTLEGVHKLAKWAKKLN